MASIPLLMVHSKIRSYKRCVGSSHGWLIMIEEDTSSVFAVNPFNLSVRVQLPSLSTFPDILDFNGEESICYSPFLGCTKESLELINNTHIKKAFLSKDPMEKGCVAMAIFGELKQLAFCSVGDNKWTIIPQLQDEEINGFEDAIFGADSRFYAVNFYGVIVSGNLNHCCPLDPLVVYEPELDEISFVSRRYLALDTEGRLLLINRYISDCCNTVEEGKCNNHCCIAFCYKTLRFRVFRLDRKMGRLVELDSLEDGVVFLGDNQSYCVSSTEFPGCKGDSIYFTDDNLFGHTESRIGGHDLGVFSIKDGFIRKFKYCPNEAKGIWPPPIWVTLPKHGPIDGYKLELRSILYL